MKKQLIMLMLIIAAQNSYSETDIYSKDGNFRISVDSEFITTFEKGSYEDLLRMVDEINRQNGINSDYLDKGTTVGEGYNDVDIVPIAQFTTNNEFIEEFTSIKGINTSDSYFNVSDLINNNLSKNELDKLQYKRIGNQKRVYLGNGNIVKNLKIVNSSDFENEVENSNKNSNTKYLLEGTYKSIESGVRNQLNISMDDYYSKIQGKSKEEVVKYLQKKLKEVKNIETVYKNGELYTVCNGKEWKVLWELEAVSVHQPGETDENKQFKDEVFTKIYIYDSFNRTNDSSGKVLYKTDGSIVIEDKFNYDKAYTQISSGYNSTKSLEKIIEEAKNNQNSNNKILNQYFKDKNELSNEEFEKKWIKPFEKGGEFDTALNNMKSEIAQKRKDLTPLKEQNSTAKKELEKIKNDSRLPDDHYIFTGGWYSEEEAKKYYDKQTKEVQELLDNYVKYNKIKDETDDKILKIELDIQMEIPKKYGFYKWGTKDESKWTSFVIGAKDLVDGILGKNIELRGKGRIDGIIDLGEGNNQLTITEQFTGKYGTNVILGAYSQLKNIDVVKVGGQIGTDSSASLSGRTSLSMDIDPTVKNKEGHLIQHAFKDSDKDIIFKSLHSILNNKYRNDFAIELMVSRISEDSVINMGRKLEYEAFDRESGEILDYKISMISDSIAHTLDKLEKTDFEGNTLLKVNIKDSLKMLNDKENEVYASIKNSGHLSSLFATLTTTNKRTNFTAEEDEKELKKDITLAKYLREKNAEEIIKDLGQFNFSKLEEDKIKENISNLKNNTVITIGQKRHEQLAKVKELNLSETSQKISDLNLQNDINNLDNLTENEITEKYNNLKKFYSNALETLKSHLDEENQKIDSVKSLNSKLSSLDSAIRWFDKYGDKKNNLKEIMRYALEISQLISKVLLENEESLDKALLKDLKDLENKKDIFDYKELHSILYYTQRQEEVLKELQTLINQVQNKNIYSRLNKVAKDEISTFTSIPFDINNDFSVNKNYVHGGSILTKNSYDSFKGNIYSGYGIYETEINNMNFGFIVGGATSNHNEIKNDTLKEVTTESKIKGVSAYLGGYNRNFLTPKLQWLNGFGLQYGEYEVNREFKNNYQENNFTSNTNVYGINLYSGLNYQYSLKDDLALNFRGLVSYSFISQEDIKEKNAPLALNIKAQNYNYLDSELGVSLNKTIFNPNSKNTLSGGIFGKFGILGYDNKNLNGKFNDSTSSMEIQGNKFKKNSIKLVLNYDVSLNSGINYGLEGTYTTNDEYNNITFGLKAGYRF